MKIECRKLVDDIAANQISRADDPRYHRLLSTHSNRDSLVTEIIGFIEPDLISLQGHLITRKVLDQLRSKQNAPWPTEIGYLDYVTDDRYENYLRHYVGQTGKSVRRIVYDHVQNLVQGRNNTLHYFILWLGNGHRSSNFLRLWSALPGTDSSIINILEALFIRAFRSDHGACNSKNGGHFDNGFGLNILSPLLQSRSFDNEQRTHAVSSTLTSPDFQIAYWHRFRSALRRQPKLSPRWQDPQYIAALTSAVVDETCISCIGLSLTSQVVHGPQLFPMSTEHQDHPLESLPHVGEPTAAVGIILDFATVVPRDMGVANSTSEGRSAYDIPWPLTRSGFNAENCLIWKFDFQPYGRLRAADLQPQSDQDLHRLSRLNHTIIRQSSIKILLICGARAWRVVTAAIEHDHRQATDFITLRSGYRFRFIVSKHDGHIPTRLYIRCPELPNSLYSSQFGSANRLCEVLKLVSVLVGFRNTRPYFMESSTAVATIVRLRRRENDGALSVTLSDLDPGLRLWLNRIGFRDTDMEKLEEVGGGIVQGIMILLHVLPRQDKGGKLPSELLPNLLELPVQGQVNHTKYIKVSNVYIDAVKALFQDIRQRTELDYQRHASQPQGFELKVLLSRPEGFSETLDDSDRTFSSGSHVEEWDAEDLEWAITEMQPVLDSSVNITEVDSNTTLFRVQRLTSITNWSKQGHTSMLYEYNLKATSANVRNIKLCHIQLITPLEWRDLNGRLLIKIELADARHPNLYAIDATQEDPAGRLAIKLTPQFDSHNDILGSYYHTASGIRAVAKANTLADKLLDGAANREIAEKARRFVYLEAQRKEYLPQHLQRFWHGGYSADVQDELARVGGSQG